MLRKSGTSGSGRGRRKRTHHGHLAGGLLHFKSKTRIVYCKDDPRRLEVERGDVYVLRVRGSSSESVGRDPPSGSVGDGG